MSKPSATQLIERAGISRTHAYDILSGKHVPSMALAIYIYRKTGWRSAPIDGTPDADLNVLEAHHRWERAA